MTLGGNRAAPACVDEWLALIESRVGQRIELGLARVAEVRLRMDARSDALLITVGGTNGKGSVVAMLEAILLAAGYRVGSYRSPHLLRYHERVRLNGVDIDDAALTAAFAAVEAARGEVALTYFEHGTLAAWHAFCAEPLDVILLEVGLGGRLDATNVFDADCAIVTSVALDHVAYLGDNREDIGFEKAGIFRAGRPAICGDPQPPERLVAHAAAIGAPLWLSGRDFGFGGDRQQWGYWRYAQPGGAGALKRRGGLAYPALRGANQLLNAASVLTALEVLRDRIPVTMQAVREGFLLVDLPGRFQIVPGKPSLVLDVAHNPQAVGALNENLSNMGFFPETWALFGMMADKAVDDAIALIAPRVDHWLLTDLPDPRALDAESLAIRVRAAGSDRPVSCFASPADALVHALSTASDDDRIVAFGSFLTVAGVMAARQARRH